MDENKATSFPDPILQLLQQLWSDPRLLVVLLALARASGPLTARQVAGLLSAAYATVSNKLRRLSALGLVSRPKVRGGWYLTRAGWQFMLVAENPRFLLNTSTTTSISDNKAVVVSEANPDSPPKSDPLTPKKRVDAVVVEELKRNGISLTAKVLAIAGRDYITPQYIYAHARRLRRRGKYSPALLIHVLDNHDELTREDRVSRRDYEYYLENREKYGG